jgi:hypothetical protein
MDIKVLPRSRCGHAFLLVLIDHATRFTFLEPLLSKHSHVVAQTLWRIMSRFGLPRVIRSDNAEEFKSSLMIDFYKLHGIDHRVASEYHPRAMGVVERANGTIAQILQKLLTGDETDWVAFIPFIEWAMNSRPHGDLPPAAVLMFGRPCNPFADYRHTGNLVVDYAAMQDRFAFMHRFVYPAVHAHRRKIDKKTAARFARQHKIVDPAATFPPGTIVMVLDENRTSKSQPKYEGPYQVVGLTPDKSFYLVTSDQTAFPRCVPINKLKKIRRDGQALLHDPDFYIVEKIIGHRPSANGYLYHIKWKDSSKTSWEPIDHLASCQHLVTKYHKRFPHLPDPAFASASSSSPSASDHPSSLASSQSEFSDRGGVSKQ